MRWTLLALLLAACGSDAIPTDAGPPDATPAGGTVTLAWTISDPGGAPLTCGGVLSTSIGLSFIPLDQAFGTSDILPCGPGSGTSKAVPPDTYDIDVSLGNVAIEPIHLTGVVIPSGGNVTIGPAAFVVDPHGGFQLTIATGTAGNCTALTSGGAGITAQGIELVDLGGNCVPATLDIAAGATQPASTYTTDCANPQPTGCIDSDQTITAEPTVPTGNYQLHLDADDGATACWSLVSGSFPVPAAGASRTLSTQTLDRSSDPACQ